MAKFVLTLDDDFDFDLIGFCTHQSDYRTCWAINSQLELRLEKSLEPFEVSGKKGSIISSHSYYKWKNEDEGIDYHLIQNRDKSGKYLIPEKAQIDFFLAIRETGIIDIDEFILKMKEIDDILTVMDFDPYELKSAPNLIFD